MMATPATPSCPALDDAVEICGFKVSTHSLAIHADTISRMAKGGRGLWLLTLNLEMVARAKHDPGYRALLRQTDLITADGMPLVWASRLKDRARPIRGRTAGVDLVVEILTSPCSPRFGIIGGTDPRRALQVLGVPSDDAYIYDGRVELTDVWIDQIVQDLQAHGTQLLFIALGAPQPDLLIAKLRPLLPNVVMIGVGGSFDFIAGIKPRAPRWMQHAGLEWLYRLSAEPRRLWRRYLLLYPSGVLWLASDILKSNFTGLRDPTSHDP